VSALAFVFCLSPAKGALFTLFAKRTKAAYSFADATHNARQWQLFPRYKEHGIGKIGRILLYLRSVPSIKVWNKIMDDGELDLISCAADIVSAYVAHNAIGADKLPDLIGSVYTALSKASVQGVEPEKPELTPAISVKKSVTPDYIVCLDDGKKFKSLKRHLRTHYDMSPEEYRAKWGLPRDYPMVAPAYAVAGSNLAKSMGFAKTAAKDRRKLNGAAAAGARN